MEVIPARVPVGWRHETILTAAKRRLQNPQLNPAANPLSSESIPTMSNITKRIIIVLAVLGILGFIALKVLITRPAASKASKPLPSPSMPDHSPSDYSPSSIARDQCRKLTNALRDFHSKRGHRPLPEGSSTDEKTVFPVNQAMLDALSGKDSAGANYLKAAGFTAPVPEGRFYAAFDFNGDGSIPDPSSPEKKVTQDILVWSSGEDSNAETWADNAFAWLK